MTTGRERQTTIYLGGVSGIRPRVPVAPAELEARAWRAMTPDAFAYIAAGAGAEATMRANRAAFDRWRIVPRVLRDVSSTDTSVELFGRRLPSPLLTAPIGVLELAHADADLAVARAARAEGVPMVFSSAASTAMEDCAAALGDSPRWFQLYRTTSQELAASFVARAEACGCEAIVLTVDTPVLGWRPRDHDAAFLPFLRGKGIAQFTSDPVFQRLVEEGSTANGPEPKPTLAALRTLIEVSRGPGRAAVQRFTELFSVPSLGWDQLGALRERTTLPILLKGIVHPEDARRAIDEGMDGIVVSNHGGRQVDGSIGTLDALPGVVEAVAGRAPVLLDSGIRTGADVLKALALGAAAVLVGRPYVYGLALAGEAGVREVLQNLRADFDITMACSGYASVGELSPEALVSAP